MLGAASQPAIVLQMIYDRIYNLHNINNGVRFGFMIRVWLRFGFGFRSAFMVEVRRNYLLKQLMNHTKQAYDNHMLECGPIPSGGERGAAPDGRMC